MYVGVCVRTLYGETTHDSVVSKRDVRRKNLVWLRWESSGNYLSCSVF